MKKQILFVIYGAIIFILGMFCTILIYRGELANVSSALNSVCRVSITGSGSFFMDWPLDILFPAVPTLFLLILMAIGVQLIWPKTRTV